MKGTVCRLLSFFVLVFAFSVSFASEDQHGAAQKPLSEEEQIREEITGVKDHHLADDYHYIFFSDKEKGKHYGFTLPVILYDNGLKIFSASEFHHGEKVVEKDGQFYKLYHSKIYKTDAQGTINYDGNFPSNEKPWDFSITKNVINILLAMVILILIFTAMAKSYKNSAVPKGIAKFLEPVVLFVKDDIAIPNIGEKHYKRFMPFLLTVFFFIWVSNLLGLTPLAVNLTGNIAITFSLAILTFVITTFSGRQTYWMHIFNPLGSSMPWYAKVPLYLLLIPIEVLGIFIKPFSLMIRLFANISAGHTVIIMLLGMIVILKSWFAGPLFFGLTFFTNLIEFLVALLQAYVFTMLSALYFGFAVEEHHETEEAH